MSDNKLNVEVSLNEAEVKEIVAQHVSAELGPDFSVNSADVTISVTKGYEDRPGGSSYPKFNNIKVKAKKDKNVDR